mmetsp:Transcript_83661/g.167043  ORF Transcript_83661/g.167043 Transcript_83661/m.167043 type:complete len:280 (+) Transcript_83661:376-1215(+)
MGSRRETSGTSNLVPASDSYLRVPRKVEDCSDRVLWVCTGPISGRREYSMACEWLRSASRFRYFCLNTLNASSFSRLTAIRTEWFRCTKLRISAVCCSLHTLRGRLPACALVRSNSVCSKARCLLHRLATSAASLNSFARASLRSVSSIPSSTDDALYRILPTFLSMSFSTARRDISCTSLRIASFCSQARSTASILCAHSASNRPFSILYAFAKFVLSSPCLVSSSRLRNVVSCCFTTSISPKDWPAAMYVFGASDRRPMVCANIDVSRVWSFRSGRL